MHRSRVSTVGLVLALLVFAFAGASIAARNAGGPVIVHLDAPATPAQVARLQAAGLSVGVAYANFAVVSGNLAQGRLAAVQSLDFVVSVRADTARTLLGGAVGRSMPEQATPIPLTYNLDFIDREKTDATGAGVYVAVLDSGLLPNWRDYLNASQVRVDLGRSFTGANGNPVPAMLERDTSGHGTAVAATVIGYTLRDRSETGQFLPQPATDARGLYLVPGVAPEATIIPIKVCDNGVYCWDSSIFSALDYVVSLRTGAAAGGELAGASFVINLSLGGPASSVEEENVYKAVTDAGVLVVASAGNSGDAGMGWPGAYPVVISVAAGGWQKQWYGAEARINNQWWLDDVPEDAASIDEWFVVWWSSREMPDRAQELDVTATGRFLLLPFLQAGLATPPPDPRPADGIPSPYVWISGTSFSSPTTAGIVALMLGVNPGLTQAEAEAILRSTALPIPAGSWDAGFPFAASNEWDASKGALGGPGTKTGWGLVQADGAVAAARGP